MPGWTYRDSNSSPTWPPPPVAFVCPPPRSKGGEGPVGPDGPDVPVVVPVEPMGPKPIRLGKFVGVPQQLLESAFAPVWGAWSYVIAIRPSALYAGEWRICGITDFRNASAGAVPA